MWSSLLGILEEGLKAWNDASGKELYNKYMSAKKEWQDEMDKRSSGRRYSQLTLDRSMRTIRDIADAYYKYVITKPK